MKSKKIGILLFIIAIIFVISETIYFGNNLLPSSTAERVCDGIGALLVIFGIFLINRK